MVQVLFEYCLWTTITLGDVTLEKVDVVDPVLVGWFNQGSELRMRYELCNDS